MGFHQTKLVYRFFLNDLPKCRVKPYTEEWGTREPQIPKRAVSALQETTYVLSM